MCTVHKIIKAKLIDYVYWLDDSLFLVFIGFHWARCFENRPFISLYHFGSGAGFSFDLFKKGARVRWKFHGLKIVIETQAKKE